MINNSTGSNDDRLRYLNDALYGYDIILVQEHWLLSNNLKRIKTALQVFTGIANSGVDEAKCVLERRPYGSCAILWRTGLTQLIKPIQVESLSKRICSIILTLNDYRLLIICAYFPTYPGSAVYSGADLDIILSDIEDILQNVNCDGIVLGGDLNSDFSHHSGFVNNINMFMNNHDLQSLWNIFNVDYTYRHTDGVSTSTIDHFIVSNSAFNKCCRGCVTHIMDNTSNHSVINLSVEMNSFVPHNVEYEKTVTSKIDWYKASSHDINLYECNINSKLPGVIRSENTHNCGNTL